PPFQGGPPRRSSIPVLALEAQTSYWTSSRPLCRGTGPTMVLAARGGHGGSRQIGPAASLHGQTGIERRERYRVGKGALLRAMPTSTLTPRSVLGGSAGRGHAAQERRFAHPTGA